MLKVLIDGSIRIGIDGNCWFVSNGECLGSPVARFVFNENLGSALDEWNNKYQDRYIYPLSSDLAPHLEQPALDFLGDERGKWL